MLKPLILLLILQTSAKLFAEDEFSLLLNQDQDSYLIFDGAFFYEDHEGKLSPEDILKLPLAAMVQGKDLKRKTWKLTPNPLWIKVHIKNHSDRTAWYVGSQRPDLSYLQVSLFRQGQLIRQVATGASIPFENRPEPIRMPFVPMDIPPHQALTLVFKIASPLHLTLPLHIETPAKKREVIRRSNYTFAVYFGTILSLVTYNFILFLLLRHRDYLMYCSFGIMMILNSLAQAGFYEIIKIRPFFDSIDDTYWVICGPPIAAMLYTRSFLKINVWAPILNRLILGAIGAGTILALLIVSPWGIYFIPFVSLLNTVCLAFVFTCSIAACLKRDPAAYVFATAWGFLAGTVGLWICGNLGIVEKNYYVAFSPLFGNMIEMLLMSIALAIRIKDLDRQKQIAELKAKESDQLKRLLRVVCHDINNPLSVIIGTIWIFKRNYQKNVDSLHLWSRVERASNAIKLIVEQVSKYEAIQVGKAKLTMSTISVQHLFDELAFLFNQKAQEKEIDLIFSLSRDPTPLTVYGDEISLTHEIMSNLISNAIKFTPRKGKIIVSAKKDGDGSVQIEVEDNGIGIPQDILTGIFDSNANTSRLGTENEPGTGFGMPLVKSYVEKFDGKISISSIERASDELNHGTKICLTFKEGNINRL